MKAEPTTPASVTPAKPAPVTDWATLPLVLRVKHLARLFDISVSAVYLRLKNDPGSLPAPFSLSPLQWSRQAVQSWLERPAALRVARRKVS
jgi:predicted DNA-binding transcriptional regulator AlpA